MVEDPEPATGRADRQYSGGHGAKHQKAQTHVVSGCPADLFQLLGISKFLVLSIGTSTAPFLEPVSRARSA